MDIAKLFHELLITADVEIIVPLLPEVFGVANQAPRHSLLQGLEGLGKRAPLRFAHQEVNVIRHHHVPIDAKTETASDALQRVLERSLRTGGDERGTAMITTECDEVSLPGLVKSFQSPGHDARVRQANCPTQAKTGLEWATAR